MTLLDEYPVVPEEEVKPLLPTIPHNRQAEEAVIGAVLINPECYFEVAREIGNQDFFIHRNRWIWEAFEELAKTRTAIDLITLSDYLERKGILAEIGGPAYLTALTNACVSSLDALDYAIIVRKESERRKGIQFANTIVSNAYDKTREFDLGSESMAIAKAARGTGQRVDSTTAAERMIELVTHPRFFSTGITDIDQRVGGLFASELSILAGYQGTGKSAAKLQGARKNADNGARVVLIDCEMTASQTWFRMACGDLGVDVNQVRADRVNDEIKSKVINYSARLGEKYQDKIVIYEAPMTPSDILAAAMMERPDVIYVDTLASLSGKPPKDNERSWYDATLKFLRNNVAKSLNCHIQVLHHINRSTFRESRKPTLHDLMFAGESDADAIFILYRKPDDYMVVNDGKVKEIVPISWITDKSRFGWTGEQEINFRLTHQSFYGMDKHYDWQDRKDLGDD